MENLSDDRENLNDFLEEAELEQYYGLFRDILKVSKVSQLKYVETGDLVQIGLSKPEQRRYKKIYSKYFPNPYLTKIKKFLGNKKNDLNPQDSSVIPLDMLPFSDNNVKVPTKHIISIEDITINKELGMGQFGVVQQGTWTTGNQRLQVAIKCLGHERMTSNSTEFLKEAALMHSIEHPNIVRLYGVVLHMDSLMLVTELAPLRSLLECVREVSLRPNFPVPTLCEFAEQICDGMAYLETKRLIHRDLAARNILVFNKDVVKISDFGLSRALGVGKDYYQTNYNVNLKLPVAWCAPECILYLRFTSSSDVWAFGVCLWEMFTYGFQPWAAFSGHQILEAIDGPKYQRLERPECCPEAYYGIMLDCWNDDPNLRPKFKDLYPNLRLNRPEQVQAIADYVRPEDGRRSGMLEYKNDQLITVIGKEDMTKTTMWYGVLAGGACGMFQPSKTKPYIKVALTSSPHPARQSSRNIRSSLLRSDVKRHTFTGKRTIQRSMISSPQGDVKHTGHVGLDGAYFGDISFLDPAGCPPRQVVTPYKPSEDLEQQPLINPNSPSHLTGASGTSPYPLLADEGGETKTKSKKSSHKSEPTTSKSILSKVKSATLGRSNKTEDGAAAKSDDEVHEYHEISDTDTESNAADPVKTEDVPPESPGIGKPSGDFGQSLLDEIDALFKSIDGKKPDESGASGKPLDNDAANRPNTLNKTEKRRIQHTGTMKPMSAHDEKTLDTAVAMANKITSKSMNDLDEQKGPSSPGDRAKFSFKFPHLTLNNAPNEQDKDANVKQERRNFSEEANNVPDIQATITEESKQAYSSLIEEPTPSYTISPAKPKTNRDLKPKFFCLHRSKPKPFGTRLPENYNQPDLQVATTSKNVLPLPPRGSKTKLVEKPRHVRKYPLKSSLPSLPTEIPPRPPLLRPIIYQNAGPKLLCRNNECDCNDDKGKNKPPPTPAKNPPSSAKSANSANSDSFIRLEGPKCANPGIACTIKCLTERDQRDLKEFMLKDDTDHVSVEDLLEFANLKPLGRQRGVESDEVRIINKVLKNKVSPDECLHALDLTDWHVHDAIKILQIRISVGEGVALEVCSAQLDNAEGDVGLATALLASTKQIKKKYK